MNLNTCLISKEPIIENITLTCGHAFEYIYLYEEIKVQKQRHKNYFKCPYCRHVYFGTIPYYELEEVDKINNVNNSKNTLPLFSCSWSKCLKPAHKLKHGLFCNLHTKTIILKTCSATCINGHPCKKKCKLELELCNIHTKTKMEKENKYINNIII